MLHNKKIKVHVTRTSLLICFTLSNTGKGALLLRLFYICILIKYNHEINKKLREQK